MFNKIVIGMTCALILYLSYAAHNPNVALLGLGTLIVVLVLVRRKRV